MLRRWGIRASPYHAGLPAADRSSLLGQFIDGRIRVMVATNAFGMGIDRTAMLRYGFPQIRLLFDGDVRVLEQL